MLSVSGLGGEGKNPFANCDRIAAEGNLAAHLTIIIDVGHHQIGARRRRHNALAGPGIGTGT